MSESRTEQVYTATLRADLDPDEAAGIEYPLQDTVFTVLLRGIIYSSSADFSTSQTRS